MNILICSRTFLPNIGGIETATDTMARALSRLGHQVAVVTETLGDGRESFPYSVLRRPSPGRLLAAVGRCDVCLHNNISLRAAWPLLVVRRPWVVVHQIYLRQNPPRLSLLERVKRFTLYGARSIAISSAVARDLAIPASVIPNSYRDDLFRLTNTGPRDWDLVFLGRLVPEKGVSLLLAALHRLQSRGLYPRLRVIGGGPEEASLRRDAVGLGIARQVEFAGPQRDECLVGMLNECRIMVVPTLWAEPFGIVALEGIACGCVVVGSSEGGLPEAIGPCGLTFPNGDAEALADCLAELLWNPARITALQAQAPAHLGRHTADNIAEEWLRVMSA
jgi:glycosyltransferase involved in cell wall biosynthesis